MDAYAQRRINDRDGLDWVQRFGWLRTHELGPLLWPNNSTARQQADRLARSWLKRKLVLARELPERAGRALVLASAGIRLLAEEGIEAVSGKDIGEMIPGSWHPPLKYNRKLLAKWLPPLTWRHDLLAAGVLVELSRKGYEIFPEAHIRRHAGALAKVPDGLARKDGIVMWLEVEAARKTGKPMRELADALCAVATREAAPVLGLRPTHALVAYRADAEDERGHTLSHRARVRAAVATAAKRDISIMWASCTIRGAAGVGSVTLETETIQADRASAILKRMEWHPDTTEEGVLVASYSPYLARVWEDEYGWSYQIDERPAGYADDMKAAKRACAETIAGL